MNLPLLLEGDARKVPCAASVTNSSKVLTYNWGTREICTITLHLPVSKLKQKKESLAEISGYPTRDFGYGKGTFSGRCSVDLKTEYEKDFLLVTTKLGKWISTADPDKKKSPVTIEGNFSADGQLELVRNEVRVFNIEDNKTRFFLKKALGSFSSTGQFRIETEIWGSIDQVLEATRYLGSPEWWSLKTETNLKLSGTELQGAFTENYILGTNDAPEVFWQSLDETIIMTRVQGEVYNVDHLLCEISGHEGLYSGELLMEPPNVKFWNGVWKYYSAEGSKELQLDVSSGLATASDVPMRLLVNGIDCIGYFTGEYCLNNIQDEFIPAGNGEWIGEADNGIVRMTGTWYLDASKNNSMFKKGTIRSDDSFQEGTWKGNAMWRGKVENCVEPAIVSCDWGKNGSYSGTVITGRAYGYGTYHMEGVVFEGFWEDGTPHGKGKKTYLSPTSNAITGCYLGTWQNGSCCGTGIFQWPDGVATFREYQENILISERSEPIAPAKVENLINIYEPKPVEPDIHSIVAQENRIKQKRRASVATTRKFHYSFTGE